MDESVLRAKREAFAKADAVCRHVLLLRCRNQGMAGQIPPHLAADLNKVEPILITRVHAALSDLCLTAEKSDVVVAFLDVVAPDNKPSAEDPLRNYPVLKHGVFINRARAELGLGPLVLPEDRAFPVVTGCNVITPQLGTK